ncbi:hypothetical protein ABW19_dt0201981 [Dactylella cylindrospora]|nr:hypothetical protein ABW19_dt0201981 [Dactylella cylindrospora]
MQRITALKPLLPSFREAIAALKESPAANFRLIKSFPPRTTSASNAAVSAKKTVCILDSSFNPPTKAHMHLAIQALQKYTPKDASPSTSPTPELLLLLATSNADKAEAPAPYDQRIAMMCLLAEEIREVYSQETGGLSPPPQVGVGITPHARFVDKCVDLGTFEGYRKEDTRQVWILGHDTLTRPGDEFGSEEVQKEYSESLDSRVVERLDLIAADEKKTQGISSTKVRKGAGTDAATGSVDSGGWKGAVCESIAEFIVDGGLYRG